MADGRGRRGRAGLGGYRRAGPGPPAGRRAEEARRFRSRAAARAAEFVADRARGDPESPLQWTTKSLRHLAGALTAQGRRCSPQTARLLLLAEGYSLQAPAKALEGSRHPDRDAQFRYISEQAREHMAAGQPVIS